MTPAVETSVRAIDALIVYCYYYISTHTKRQQQVFGGDFQMSNQDIRRAAAGAGVKLWQIADALGISDCSFSRKLRKELPQEEKKKIFSIIEQLSQEVG